MRALAFSVAVTLVSGCSASQVPVAARDPAPEQRLGCARACGAPARALSERVYVSDEAGNVVEIFDRSGKNLGALTSELNYPQGLFVDAEHNLYVTNRGASNVLVFPRGATSPSARLSDPNSQPEGVTMCPDGTLYVANIIAASGAGNVAVYPPGKRRPARTLTYSGGNFFFVTCDAAGNVFATLVFGTTGTVIAFPNGRQAGATLLPIYTPGNPGGIKLDGAGNLLFNNGVGSVIEYTETGTPTGVSVAYAGAWTDIALDARGNVLLGADSADRDAVALRFPGGTPVETYSSDAFSTPIGVAFDPAQI
jgi:DNA-binding beta-propeller fold protein YncE